MTPAFVLLLFAIGLVLLSLGVDKTTFPTTLKRLVYALAIGAVALFVLYCGLIALGWLGLGR